MMLASELRRRRVKSRALVDAVGEIERSTWVMGDLRSSPTSILVLAAISLTTRADERPPSGDAY